MNPLFPVPSRLDQSRRCRQRHTAEKSNEACPPLKIIFSIFKIFSIFTIVINFSWLLHRYNMKPTFVTDFKRWENKKGQIATAGSK